MLTYQIHIIEKYIGFVLMLLDKYTIGLNGISFPVYFLLKQ